MRTDLAEFWRIEAAFLLAREEEALFWAPEFRVALPEVERS